MKGIAASIFFSILGTLLALFAVELLIRVFIASDTKTTWSDRPSFYFAAEGRPSMQGPAYAPEKPASTFRIAVVGDSFSFAPYMQFTDTFSAKLEQMLNTNLTQPKVEVINYGVPAYSATHEVSVVQKALQEGADLIILQVTLNDPEIKAHTPTGITENMQDQFGAQKLSGFVATLTKYWKTFGFVLNRLHNSKTHGAYRDYFLKLFNDPRSYEPYKQATTKMVRLAKAANRPLVAVVFPLFGLALDKSYPFNEIHQKVANLFSELQTPQIDLSDSYKNIPLERLQVIPGFDRHPNEIAHRMAAERIYIWLKEIMLIPDEIQIKGLYRNRLGTEKHEVF